LLKFKLGRYQNGWEQTSESHFRNGGNRDGTNVIPTWCGGFGQSTIFRGKTAQSTLRSQRKP
jgi:hypothetical protein